MEICQIVTERVLKTGLGCLKYLGMLRVSNVSIIEKFLRLLILCGNPHQVVTVLSWCFFQVSGKDQCANRQCLQKSHGHYWQLCASDDRDSH